jgi:hypothetical protein
LPLEKIMGGEYGGGRYEKLCRLIEKETGRGIIISCAKLYPYHGGTNGIAYFTVCRK